MRTSSMEFHVPDGNQEGGQSVIIAIMLSIGVWLSKAFDFRITAFIGQFARIDWGDTAKYVDAFFHYGLLVMTFCFTGIKFYDYMKQRRKNKKSE